MQRVRRGPSTQVTGNVGLYMTCAELSKLGFNVMPTARNARGVDIVGYDAKGRSFTVQVKTLTKAYGVPMGTGDSRGFADYLILVVLEGKYSGFYVWTRREMQRAKLVSNVSSDGRRSYWFSDKEWRDDAKAHGGWDKVTKALGKGGE